MMSRALVWAVAGCVGAALGAGGAGTARGAVVLVLSSGSTSLDALVEGRLENLGHQVTIGPAFAAFNGTLSLAPYDAVYMQANINWATGDMPVTGQLAMRNWISAGGGLVTGEWVIWKAATEGGFQSLAPIFAAPSVASTRTTMSVTFIRGEPDPILNLGMPLSFSFAVDDLAGTESLLQARTGATVFYTNDAGAGGMVGWNSGAGRVMHCSTTNLWTQVGDPAFGRLLSNALSWAAEGGGGGTCPADFNSDGTVNVQDFLAFLGAYAIGDARADFTGDGIVNVQDFLGFLGEYAAGC